MIDVSPIIEATTASSFFQRARTLPRGNGPSEPPHGMCTKTPHSTSAAASHADAPSDGHESNPKGRHPAESHRYWAQYHQHQQSRRIGTIGTNQRNNPSPTETDRDTSLVNRCPPALNTHRQAQQLTHEHSLWPRERRNNTKNVGPPTKAVKYQSVKSAKGTSVRANQTAQSTGTTQRQPATPSIRSTQNHAQQVRNNQTNKRNNARIRHRGTRQQSCRRNRHRT